jgi:hypothetical protein
MKNLTKNRGFFAAAAALLVVTAMLVTIGCSSDISSKSNEFTPPAGKGAVKLSFNKEIARTILPDNITADDFDEFEFQFTPTDSSGIVTGTAVSKIFAQGDQYDPIILDPGYYDLIIIAYLDFSKTATPDMKPVATNADAVNILITAAKLTNTTITLKPYDPTTGTGNGIFKYKIITTILSDIEAAEMTLSEIGGSNGGNVDILTDGEIDGDYHELSVPAGYYYVDFVITVESGDEVTFRQLVHIMQHMSSSYEFTISKDYFFAVLKFEDGDIIYQGPSDNKPVLSIDGGTTGLAEGATITITNGGSQVITVQNVTSFTSFEWYSQGSTNLQPVSAGTYTVNTSTGTIFSVNKTYQLTIIGITSTNDRYSSYIYIKVVP